MKKIVSILLVLSMCITLCACGGSENTSTESTATEGETTENETVESEVTEDEAVESEAAESETVDTASMEEATEDENNEITFEEGTMVLDNDVAAVELVNFYEESNGEGGTDKYVTFKVLNKGTKEFLFMLLDSYIGENGVSAVMYDGNVGPMPGKTKIYRYKITNSDPEFTSIETLDQLYELEGTLYFSVYSEDGEYIDNEVEEYFSFKDLNLK